MPLSYTKRQHYTCGKTYFVRPTFDYYTTTTLPPQKHLCALNSAMFIDFFQLKCFLVNKSINAFILLFNSRLFLCPFRFSNISMPHWTVLSLYSTNKLVQETHRVVDRGILSHISNMTFQFWTVLGSVGCREIKCKLS